MNLLIALITTFNELDLNSFSGTILKLLNLQKLVHVKV